jgi:hypothetical protein
MQVYDGATWKSLLPPDITPDSFSFTAQTNVAISTVTSSNIVQITGIDAPTPASVSGLGSQFRICSDATCAIEVQTWGKANQSVSNNQYVQTRITSSATSLTLVTASLTVGTGTSSFNVTTQNGATACSALGGTYSSPNGTHDGGGGFATGSLAVTPGQILNVYVGEDKLVLMVAV